MISCIVARWEMFKYRIRSIKLFYIEENDCTGCFCVVTMADASVQYTVDMSSGYDS